MGKCVAQETYRIVIEGSELVEFKRHAHQISECPDLDRRIQRYDGNKPLVISLDELDWLVAVLDAVLHDPKGYPCVEYEPWKLEYVPPSDERCVACRQLYDRLEQESDRLTANPPSSVHGETYTSRPGLRFRRREGEHCGVIE